MNIAMLGLGEVGSALKQLIGDKHQVFVRELTYNQVTDQHIDVAHVSIPYNQKFESIVVSFVEEIKPDLTIINSTVKPGTTEAIFKKTNRPIVHSPFMGVHPIKPKHEFIHQGVDLRLADYFDRFTKIIGPVDAKSGKLARAHFKSLGLKTQLYKSPLETELAKVLCTTYYGWNILFEKWVHQLCEQTGANFDQVYTDYNHNYNNGYKEVLPHVVRPVLKHHDGPIGGHCVIPNADIIQDWLSDEFSNFLLTQNQKLTKKSGLK